MKFFLLVFTLSLPFWLAGALTSSQLVPGASISALMFVCPVMAAAILIYREDKLAGVKELLKRSFDFNRVTAKMWYVPLLLIQPCIMVLSYLAMRLMGVFIPVPQFSLVRTLALFGGFFIGALGEELGWSGYAIDPLQNRYGALWGAILLGVVWSVWHIIPLLESQRSLDYIAWWGVGTVSARVIITWLYNNTGNSVFVAAVFHVMMNVTWQLFPVSGSYYDPRIGGLITAAVAVVVILVWGPRQMRRPQPGALPGTLLADVRRQSGERRSASESTTGGEMWSV